MIYLFTFDKLVQKLKKFFRNASQANLERAKYFKKSG